VLVARDSAMTRPGSGGLPLSFKHILSKVNFSVSTWDNAGRVTDPEQKVFVLAVGFCNLHRSALYHVHNETWDTLFPERDTYDYFNSFTPLTTGFYQDIMFIDTVNAPFYSSASGEKEHLILLPQQPNMWDITGTTISDPDINEEAYIRMLYRLENLSGDIVGFATAESHDDYVIGDYDGPLYVLVGYAFDANWESAGSYQYDIPIPGTGGGILLDIYYYDNQDKPTKFIIDGKNLYDRIM